VKNVTKLISGRLMIECQQKQMLNLLSLKQIYSIIVYATPHRILNSIRGIIRYREEDLDDPTGSFDNFVSGIPHSLLFKTTSRDQLSETSVSSSSLVPTVILYLSRLRFRVLFPLIFYIYPNSDILS
jgi:hypothetical protein